MDVNEMWDKAKNTMEYLQSYLAWSKNLPREIRKNKSLVNLLRILIRCNRLYRAKRDAEQIFELVLVLRKELTQRLNDDKKVE